MNQPTRQPPRFVPTLTEVIEPTASRPPAPDHGDNVEALVARICEQVQPKLARRLQQESEQWLRATLAQHLRDVDARIQSDLESVVRETVMSVLKTQNRPDPTDISLD
ncbi:MAG: hypothetical protein PSV24_01000 [Rhodoferax sp.]|nr:hypothetical protein [Rhodoferax sp.]